MRGRLGIGCCVYLIITQPSKHAVYMSKRSSSPAFRKVEKKMNAPLTTIAKRPRLEREEELQLEVEELRKKVKYYEEAVHTIKSHRIHMGTLLHDGSLSDYLFERSDLMNTIDATLFPIDKDIINNHDFDRTNSKTFLAEKFQNKYKTAFNIKD